MEEDPDVKGQFPLHLDPPFNTFQPAIREEDYLNEDQYNLNDEDWADDGSCGSCHDELCACPKCLARSSGGSKSNGNSGSRNQTLDPPLPPFSALSAATPLPVLDDVDNILNSSHAGEEEEAANGEDFEANSSAELSVKAEPADERSLTQPIKNAPKVAKVSERTASVASASRGENTNSTEEASTEEPNSTVENVNNEVEEEGTSVQKKQKPITITIKKVLRGVPSSSVSNNNNNTVTTTTSTVTSEQTSQEDYFTTEARDYECTVCLKTFKRRVALEQHQQTMHGYGESDDPTVNHLAAGRSSRIAAAAAAYEQTSSAAPSTSTLASTTTSPKSRYQPHQCPHCRKVIKGKGALVNHIKAHNLRQNFLNCETCGESNFKDARELRAHLQYCASRQQQQQAQQTQEQEGPDNSEDEVGSEEGDEGEGGGDPNVSNFPSKHSQYIGNSIPDADGNFECEHCGKILKNKYRLAEHVIRRHTAVRPHACTFCPRTFVTNSELKVHTRTHTGERPYLCNQCGHGFSVRSNLVKHVRAQHGRDARGKAFKRFGRFIGEPPANRGGYQGPRLVVPQGSRQVVPQSRPIQVNHSTANLRQHSSPVKASIRPTPSSSAILASIPKSKGPLSCPHCNVVVANRHRLADHITRRHTTDRPHQCPLCPRAFVSSNELLIHNRLHTGERPYVCGSCDAGFTTKSSLVKHYRRKHGKDIRTFKKGSGGRRIYLGGAEMKTAPVASAGRFSTSLATTFTATSTPSNAFNGKRSSNLPTTPSNNNSPRASALTAPPVVTVLNDDEEDALDVKPCIFFCPYCPRGFVNEYVQKVHVRAHEKESAQEVKTKRTTGNQCKHCSMSFILEQDLARHQQQSHGISISEALGNGGQDDEGDDGHEDERQEEVVQNEPTTFPCAECPKTFSSEDYLEKHMLTHRCVLMSAYKCRLCGQFYESMEEIVRHQKSHHSSGSGTGSPAGDNRQQQNQRNFVPQQRAQNQNQNQMRTGSTSLVAQQQQAAYLRQNGSSVSSSPIPSPSNPNVHQCPICRRLFNRKGSLTNHIKAHGLEESKQEALHEQLSGQGLMRRPSQLQQQRMVPTTPQRFQQFRCAHCEKTFRHQSTLKTHLLFSHNADDASASAAVAAAAAVRQGFTPFLGASSSASRVQGSTGGQGFENNRPRMNASMGSLAGNQQLNARFVNSNSGRGGQLGQRQSLPVSTSGGQRMSMVDNKNLQFNRRQSNQYHPYQQQQQSQQNQQQNQSQQQQNLNGTTQTLSDPFQCTFCHRVFTAQRYLTNHLKVHKHEMGEHEGEEFMAQDQDGQDGQFEEEGYEDEDDMGYLAGGVVGVEVEMDDEEDEYEDDGEEDDVVMLGGGNAGVHLGPQGNNQRRNQFPCNQCDRVFSHLHVLRAHLTNHQSVAAGHRGPSLDVHQNENEDVYDNGGQEVGFEQNLMYQQEDDEGEGGHFEDNNANQNGNGTAGGHACPHCGKVFLSNANLIIHIRIHTGERPYHCDDCNVSFTNSSHLYRHYRTASHRSKVESLM